MTERYVTTISEDDVSNAVIEKLVSRHTGKLVVHTSRVTGGFGNIKSNILAFNNAAKALPQIVLVDLDKTACAPELISSWLGQQQKHKDLILRVAVTEVEAWLLADRQGIADFLGVATNLVPQYPEGLVDPKAELVRVARHCRDRRLRDAIVPFGTAPVGPAYNPEITRFVRDLWCPATAAAECESLKKMMSRLQGLADEPWPAE